MSLSGPKGDSFANKYRSTLPSIYHFALISPPLHVAATMDTAAATDHRRQRRIILNRESARRSRTRKQRHLEDLRSRVRSLRIENRILAQRIAASSAGSAFFRNVNDRLQMEFVYLRKRLLVIRRLVFLRQLQRLSLPPSPAYLPSSTAAAGSASG
ncbi:hypothetical protein HPP92_019118 [Vanilla planifolia]|uniref:BZIP domain-containing protein n=1 Tax=Vanilla planifolia TaxID=51239 RepID=A0A835Q8D8_VANPL|nr:hypothetical protein HPP92_019632 [Vanilla planifolia]KAG0464954.1 hypothetical protein HPP92_019118 [Vanilla planifolia]